MEQSQKVKMQLPVNIEMNGRMISTEFLIGKLSMIHMAVTGLRNSSASGYGESISATELIGLHQALHEVTEALIYAYYGTHEPG